MKALAVRQGLLVLVQALQGECYSVCYLWQYVAGRGGLANTAAAQAALPVLFLADPQVRKLVSCTVVW